MLSGDDQQPGETVVEPIQIERAMAELQSTRASFLRIVQVFLRSGQTLADEIRAAIAEGDTAKASFAVHKLKGGAASVYAEPMRNAAVQLEDILARGAFPEAEAALHGIRKKLKELSDFVA